jgi:hypothetical protein
MNQMALMAQMATSMGMLNPTTGQMMGGGFPGMQQGDMGMYQGGGAFGQGQAQAQGVNGRGRGGGRGGRGRGGGPGRGGFIGASPAPSSESPTPTQTQVQPQHPSETNTTQPVEHSVPIVAPTPTLVSIQQPPLVQQQRIPYALPERPQSPTLCKFGTKCTNSQCRYSHPSPVATAESGVVLSTDACEKGKDCKDKDCIKSHVSPAVNTPGRQESFYRLVPLFTWSRRRRNSKTTLNTSTSPYRTCLFRHTFQSRPLPLRCLLHPSQLHIFTPPRSDQHSL